ncbi:MAG: TIM-barrel domain-containing protein [Anaerolineae bacterium]
MIPTHFQIPVDPVAPPEAIVLAPHLRLTVLTSQLIRIEHSLTDEFVDQASQLFWYRRQPVPPFQIERSADAIAITTEHLRLDYRITPEGPSYDTLSIQVLATGSVWHFGEKGEGENLRGTARTLDGVDGAVRLERGLMSKNGWAIVDDSKTLLINVQGWVEARTPAKNVDLYFFGYGREFKKCLQDFARLTGHTPMVPRWMLGNWWSRYWEYTQQELLDLMADFEQHAVPLAVCIVDMDWHITQTENRSSGWTGYTWNRKLFPDPEGCLRALHAMGLRVSLNLHPAEGVHPHEGQYAEMARALGLDPASNKPVGFDLSDPAFVQAYFEILHHPYETQGVDFWWLDWQQGTLSKLPGLDPLTWLNHLHFYDLGRNGARRPIIFSRWGGLGGHRYPIGFSGDTVVSWASLAFQPYMTATAANVGYGWWSHDIGGHMRGIEEPELYARWVQYGVFSPIFRLHSTKNPYHDRRPWGNGEEVFRVAREAMQLRHALIPYLYTMAWRNTTQDLPLVTPMYYDDPNEEAAYRCPNQYRFGSELIAAPFITPQDPDTRLARQTVWLPRGNWFNFFTGEHLAGGRWHTLYGGLDEIPVIARTGAIIPLGPRAGWGGTGNPAELTVEIFPGADNRFELYEDDGETTAYQQGRFARTPFESRWHGDAIEFTIGAVNGEASLAPSPRTYHLRLHGIRRPDHVRLMVNSVAQEVHGEYDPAGEVWAVTDVVLMRGDEATLLVESRRGGLMASRDRRQETCLKMLRAFKMDARLKHEIDRDLDKLLLSPNRLYSYGPGLKDAHLAALASVLESHST